MKNKLGHRFNFLLIIVAIVISINIAVVYVEAGKSDAQDIVIPDEKLEIEITDTVKTFEDAVECYTYAEAHLLQSTCSSVVSGSVKGYAPWGSLMVHQTMDNTRVFDNDGIRYSTSTSLKKGSVGRNNYQKTAFDPKVKDGKVYRITTVKDKNGEPNYAESNWEEYSQEEYVDIYGAIPGGITYLVRESTVKKVELFERTEDDGYHMILTLDNALSTQGYKKLLKISAGDAATGYPKFSKVQVEAWIDKDGNFVKNILMDEAKIPMLGFDCKMVSYYEETFTIIGGNVEQPFEAPFK